ncbi:MAG: tetratricopeptide repeat protein [Candidatus Gottesmanbacteria bacterium]|nr:tetratricopeptide repeat protein [Candidatus Gottesmanbacteria bacterium]
MHPTHKTTADHIGSWTIIATAGLLPLYFLPLTQDYYDTNKWMLLVSSALIVTGLWIWRSIASRSLSFSWNATTKSLGCLSLVSLVSLLVPTIKALFGGAGFPDGTLSMPSRIEAFTTPLGTGTMIAVFLLAFLGSTFFDEKSRGTLRWVLYTVVSLTGLVAIYQFFGLSRAAGLTGLAGLAYLADPLWTPVGTSVGLMTILAVTIPLLIGEIIHRKKQGADTHMIAAILMTIAAIGGLILTAFQAFPLLLSGMLPYWAAWQVLLESWKNLKQLFVGVGAENFITAFTAGRPAILNMTGAWSTRYAISSSFLFHIATIYGILGLTALGYFFVSLIRGKHTVAVFISRIIALIAFILLPPSFPALVVFIMVLMMDTHGNETHITLPKKPVLLYGLGCLILLLTLWASYGLIRVYRAELAFGRSLAALQKREGTAAYNAQIEAITLNPGIARFHTSYSQTNLSLANALAGTASSSAQPEQVKKDRETATQLVQQAIREAKIAVNLAPNNILVWENIAAVYQELTGVAQGADQWTVASYSQAMQLDPTNPALRLRLGGAYVGQQKFDRASEQYIAAIGLKPDFANAYYNLGFVYRETKKYLAAAQAIREALKYVTPGSDGATQGQNELDALRNLLTEKEKAILDNANTVQTNEPLLTPAPKKSATEPLSPLP